MQTQFFLLNFNLETGFSKGITFKNQLKIQKQIFLGCSYYKLINYNFKSELTMVNGSYKTQSTPLMNHLNYL